MRLRRFAWIGSGVTLRMTGMCFDDYGVSILNTSFSVPTCVIGGISFGHDSVFVALRSVALRSRKRAGASRAGCAQEVYLLAFLSFVSPSLISFVGSSQVVARTSG